MPNASSGGLDRLIRRFDVHVCRPEGSATPAALLHSLFHVQLGSRLSARFGATVGSITLERCDDEAAWFRVEMGTPVFAVAAAFCVDAAATAAGVSIPGGHIRVFPGDIEVPVSEVNDIPCAAAV